MKLTKTILLTLLVMALSVTAVFGGFQIYNQSPKTLTLLTQEVESSVDMNDNQGELPCENDNQGELPCENDNQGEGEDEQSAIEVFRIPFTLTNVPGVLENGILCSSEPSEYDFERIISVPSGWTFRVASFYTPMMQYEGTYVFITHVATGREFSLIHSQSRHGNRLTLNGDQGGGYYIDENGALVEFSISKFNDILTWENNGYIYYDYPYWKYNDDTCAFDSGLLKISISDYNEWMSPTVNGPVVF